MNKYKLTNNQKLHIIILTVLYATWIIGIHVLMAIANNQDEFITYTNLVGSFLALLYTIFLHYPLIPFMSKYINARTEKEAVKIRREYAIQALYCIILGFFACAFSLFLKVDIFEEHPFATSFGVIFIVASCMMTPYSIFTVKYWEKMKILMYVDKLQHKNADIEN